MFSDTIIKRLHAVWISISVIFLLLTLRTGYVMLIWGKELRVITDNQYSIDEQMSDINFSLQDNRGKELLSYKRKYYFVVDADTFIRNNRDTDIKAIKTLIYTLRNYNKNYNLDELKPGMEFRQTYNVDEATYRELKRITGVKGVYAFERGEVDRGNFWKHENLLSSFTTRDNKPKAKDSIEGIIQEATKNNNYPVIRFEKDVSGQFEEGKYIFPSNNVNVRLTTDKDIQEEIKEILLQPEYKKYDQIGVALMEASSGKIKAMVQRDDWKPNVILGSETANGYEPGSIFKTLVEEAAIEKGGILATKKYLCEEEKKQHGYIGMIEAFTVSCNTYFSRLGNAVGFSNILKLAEAQGIYSKVLNFQEEVTGDYVKPKAGDGTVTNLSIGQSMRITPIQALSIVNTVVNNGKYVKPYIIDSLVKDNGEYEDEIIKKFSTEEKQVVRKSTADNIKRQMKNVVQSDKGTGKQAYSSNIETGGKTGTNTRYEYLTKEDENGQKVTESTKHSDGWFTGFYRINGKYYSMVVFVKDIDTDGEGGGTTAAPIFKEIVEKIQKYQS